MVTSTLRKIFIVSIIILIIIPITGRLTNKGPEEKRSELSNRAKTEQSAGNEITAMDGRIVTERTRKIKQDIEKQKYVKDSSVILIGDTAVIGVTFSGDNTGADSRTYLREMENRIRKLDKSLSSVVMTKDPDLFENISHIEDMAGKGAPLNSLARDIAEVLRNIDFFDED